MHESIPRCLVPFSHFWRVTYRPRSAGERGSAYVHRPIASHRSRCPWGRLRRVSGADHLVPPRSWSIPSGNLVPGTITATFDLYTRPYGPIAPGATAYAPQGPAVLVDQFSLGLGSDFYVVIPQAVVNTHASWEMPIPTGTFGTAGWPVAGLHSIAQSFPGGTDVATLFDWCSLPNHGFVDDIFVIARRGTCAFADKVENIQTRNGVGALIVNHNPLDGAIAMSLGTFVAGVPVISLSYERGQQIMALLNAGGPTRFQISSTSTFPRAGTRILSSWTQLLRPSPPRWRSWAPAWPGSPPGDAPPGQ